MKYHITPTSSGLAWKTCQLASLACEQCQIPNMLLPHDVCCVWHRSHLISVPCQWDDFLKNCWPKKGRLQSFLLMCTLLFLHSKGAACFFPLNTLPCLWRAWADTDTADASMGNRNVAWKRDCLAQQVIQEFDTQRSLGRSSEVTQSAEQARL